MLADFAIVLLDWYISNVLYHIQYVEMYVWKVYMHENVRRCMKSKDNRITKGYNSIRSNTDIFIIEGDQYIKESQLENLVVSKRSTVSS